MHSPGRDGNPTLPVVRECHADVLVRKTRIETATGRIEEAT